MRVVSDPVRLEVLKNALEGIADGMAITVVRTSCSSVVRQSMDFSTGVLNALGELIGQGFCNPTHLGGMVPALKACMDRYPGQIYPGDILANNDPYEGASHLPDIFLFKPVYAGEILTGFLCAMSHHTDIGGRVAGGNACDSTEIYQEGLRIPPLKLYSRGIPNETLFCLLEKAVRVPDKVMGDIKSNVTALNFGEREYLKLVERYGVEEMDVYTDELLDYTEELTRKAIRTMPEGTWSFTDYLDDDGIDPDSIAIVATLTKAGDEIHVDFTGTSPQCKGAIQPVFATTKSMAYATLKCVLGAVGVVPPNTGGYFRPIKVTAPEGTFVNPLLPAPVAARGLGIKRITHAIFGAYAQMLPDKVFACPGGAEFGIGMSGYDKSQTPWKPWVQLEFHNEQSTGGRPDKDGIDAQGTGTSNLSNNPVETLEVDQPIRMEEYALNPDTEGAGRHRGGLGMIREYRYLMDDTVVQVRSDRKKHPPYGLQGGHRGSATRVVVTKNGKSQEMPSKFLVTLNRGDVLRIEWSGAGGWGNPVEREPQLVLEDVIAQKISVERAREVYRVVIDPKRRLVDEEATARLRHHRLRGAGKVPQ